MTTTEMHMKNWARKSKCTQSSRVRNRLKNPPEKISAILVITSPFPEDVWRFWVTGVFLNMKMKTMFLFVCAPFLISKKAVSCTWEEHSRRVGRSCEQGAEPNTWKRRYWWVPSLRGEGGLPPSTLWNRRRAGSNTGEKGKRALWFKYWTAQPQST